MATRTLDQTALIQSVVTATFAAMHEAADRSPSQPGQRHKEREEEEEERGNHVVSPVE